MNIETPGALASYLRRRGYAAPDEPLPIRVLRGGVSNRTVWVGRAGGDWVVKQALSRLRVATEWRSDPARIFREAEGMRILAPLLPDGTILPFLFEDRDHGLLAMAAAPEPHENWKTQLLAGRIDAGLVRQFGEALGHMHHRFDAEAYPADGLLRDRSFFESLRVEPYYRYTVEQVPAAAGFIERLVARTDDAVYTLVHGDYSPKNVLVYEGRMILLDHEVIHIGDPAFDLGFSLTHLLSKAHHLPERRTAFADAALAYWAAYVGVAGHLARWGDLEARAAAHTLACLLARVAGRSPLEYLAGDARRAQREAVVSLMERPPATIHETIHRFIERIDACR